jgi:2-succinyl-6-hydroxy-2,4-cyclohexadiene-1-carboxylate synthase
VGVLTYTLSGDAQYPTVLFLHGFMGSSEDRRDAVAPLDGRYLCLAMDLPGHGASLGLPPADYTVEGATWTLLGLLDGLDVERPAVVGSSMGGRLGLHLALRHPERCARLFLQSASPGLEGAAERQARREAGEERARRLASGDFGAFLAVWYRQPLLASLARHEGLMEKIIETRWRNDPGELARSLRGMGTGNQPSLWGKLGGLEVPALAVTGVLDEKYTGISRRMASLSPRVRTAVVPSAGHNVHLEAPEAYLALLQDFLETL